MAGEIVQKVDLQWDSKSAEHSVSDFAKNFVKQFNHLQFDPLKQFNKDLNTAKKNVAELTKKIEENKGKPVKIGEFIDKEALESAKADLKEWEQQLKEFETKPGMYRGSRAGMEEEKIIKDNISELEARITKLKLPIDETEIFELTDQFKQLTEELENQKNIVEALEGNYSKVLSSLDIDQAIKQFENLETEIEVCKELLQEATEQGDAFDIEYYTKTIQQLEAELQNITEAFPEITGEVQRQAEYLDVAESSAKSYEEQIALIKQRMEEIANIDISGMTDEQVDKLAAEYEKLNNQLIGLEENQRKASNATKEHTKSISNQGRAAQFSLGKILGYAIGIRSLYSLFYKLKAAAKEGLGYAANYSSVLKNSMNQLSSSFTMVKAGVGAAISPLVNVFAPVVARIAILCTQAANAVARFFAVITGKKSVIQAKTNIGSFSKAMSGAGKAAKDAAKDVKKSLAPFDDLQVLAKDTADDLDDLADGLGGGVGDLGSDMFTTLDLDSYSSEFLDKLREWIDSLDLEPITEAWNRLKEALDGFFGLMQDLGMWVLENVLFPLGTWLIEKDIPTTLNLIAAAIELITTSLEILAPYLKIVWDLLSPVFKVIGDIIIRIKELITEGLEKLTKWLKENKDKPEAAVVALGVIIGAILLVVGAIKLLKEWLGHTKTASDESTTGIGNLTGGFENLWSTLGKAALIASIGYMLQGLADVISSLVDLLKTMHETGTSIWDLLGIILVILGPLAIALGALLAVVILFGPQLIVGAAALLLIASAIDLVSKAVERILKALTELIDKPVRTLIEFIDKIKADGPEIIQKVTDLTTKIINLNNKIKELAKEIKNLGEVVKTFKKTVTDSCKAIEDKIKDLLKIFKEKAEEFKKIIENMQKKFVEAANKISSTPIIIKVDASAVDVAIGKVNALISAVNAANSLSINIGGGGGSISVPGLASGGVLPPNQPFLAMLGDQKHGTNIEAPLDTIVEAMQRALASMNYVNNQEVVLNIDGTEFARLTLPNTLDELNRQGYNVQVLEDK